MARFDGRGPSTSFHERQPQERLGQEQERLDQEQERVGPITRSMTKRLDEDLDKATDGRETFLYMFQEAHQA